MIVITMFLILLLAFQSGQMYTMIDIDKVDGVKPNWKLYFFMVADGLIAVYLFVALVGRIAHG
jgi:hypothetical protein